MKRFHLLSLLTLFIVGGAVTLAAMPSEKKVVKTEVSSVMDATYVATISEAIELNYVVATDSRATSEFKPPTEIGQFYDLCKISISTPLNDYEKANLLPEIRRLSCTSVAAASSRHY